MLRLTPSHIASFYRPSACERRVLLRHLGEKETEPPAYEQVLRKLGERHEHNHANSFGELIEIGTFPRHQRVKATLDAIAQCAPVIYQPVFVTQHRLAGTEVEIEGIPDLIVRDGNSYIIRDVKMARRIDDEHHPEIMLQVQLYGWLFEQSCGMRPKALQVWGGTSEITEIPDDGGKAALKELGHLLETIQNGDHRYEPVGWSKCGGCGYRDKCWAEAEAVSDVSLILGVDQGLARKLHELGIDSTEVLLANFDAEKLGKLKRPYGKRQQKVGKTAERILQRAEAMRTKSEAVVTRPILPAGPNWVMFDLEGMPPHLDEMEKVYLWGMQVFGEHPSGYIASVSDFGLGGDRDGWIDFLGKAKRLFEDYGDIPFVHWANYEGAKLDLYIARFGDPEGIAARVRANLFDLLVATRDSMVLPLPSLSLKVVEEYVGYKRSQTKYGGDWSMATFIEATETCDEKRRRELMDAIQRYNAEDLEATWAVFRWLRGKVIPANLAPCG
jgi:predicted RecB family nuclease